MNIQRFKQFINENLKSRVLSKIQKLDSGCWKWKKHIGTDHYGQINVNGQAEPAHRITYKLFKGSIPSGKLLMHTCDHRWCVNPAHLKIGTKQQNNDDTSNKGRSRNQHTGTLKGSPNNVGDR